MDGIRDISLAAGRHIRPGAALGFVTGHYLHLELVHIDIVCGVSLERAVLAGAVPFGGQGFLNDIAILVGGLEVMGFSRGCVSGIFDAKIQPFDRVDVGVQVVIETLPCGIVLLHRGLKQRIGEEGVEGLVGVLGAESAVRVAGGNVRTLVQRSHNGTGLVQRGNLLGGGV